MKTIMMMAFATAMLSAVSCGSKKDAPQKKVLVLYYSQAGNTKTVAQELAAKLGADVEEIVPVKPYEGDFQALFARYQQEREQGILPELKPIKADLTQYDVIFLGFPIWDGIYALPMAAFLETADLSGKKIVPFCSFGSGGLDTSIRALKEKICHEVCQAFGGRMYEVIVGGAALSKEVEDFLLGIGFPITVGYGTTECAPLISYCDYKEFVAGCCGKAVDRMEVRILSADPEHVPGEIVTRGTNVMLGYYKNEEATREVIDDEGWYHTGDLGTLSSTGHVFIRGRIKNMLLGPNGQNIYPEEIEDKLNSMPMVSESVVVQRGDKLVALVYPDKDERLRVGEAEDSGMVVSFTREELEQIMEQNRTELNRQLPPYSRLAAINLRDEEFQKTPKKSIKRYLYNT